MGSVVTQLGSTSAGSGSSTLVLTTSADSPAGSTIVVVAAESASAGITSAVDSAGNTYIGSTVLNNGTGKSRFFWVQSAAELVGGGTITITFSGAGAAKLVAAVVVMGPAPVNLIGAGTSGSGTTPSVATGTLGSPNEIIFGMCQVASGASDGYAEATGFTSNTAALSTDGLHWAYQTVTSNASVTYSPTLGTSRSWGVNTLTFAVAAAPPFNPSTRFSYLEM